MKQIVECVPNFSDGRRPNVYNAIADAIRAVDGIQLLDLSADYDHNRTVVTFIGPPEAVEEAAFAGIKIAAEQINLDGHTGEHPRLGATDVCPFIPVKGVTLADCVAIARRLGERVGRELGIAVYLYAAAATRPERELLAHIRRGEYEGWKKEVGSNPAREPDFGPATPQKWGATVIGARPFLIAYNLYLNSDNDVLADQIARKVRFSSGGLRFVQAKGFLVDGQAQVSMNLTNFEKTPLHQVQELVRREAAAYGLSITHAELVGLAPQKALTDAALAYLQLHGMAPSQVLETRLEATIENDRTPEAFLASTAAATPAPGGGSAAAMTGALGAALAQMVAGLTEGRKRYAAVNDEAQSIGREAAQLRRRLADAIVEDAAAFGRLMDAWKSKDPNNAAREREIEAATIAAGETPLMIARLSLRVAQLAAQIAAIGNRNAVTDAAAGAILAHAAVQVAVLNVKTNGVNLQDAALIKAWHEEAKRLVEATGVIAADVQRVAADRGGF